MASGRQIDVDKLCLTMYFAGLFLNDSEMATDSQIVLNAIHQVDSIICSPLL